MYFPRLQYYNTILVLEDWHIIVKQNSIVYILNCLTHSDVNEITGKIWLL